MGSVACGAYHTVVLTDDGALYACGYNEHGLLGLGHKDAQVTLQKVEGLESVRSASVACGAYHTVVLAEPTIFDAVEITRMDRSVSELTETFVKQLKAEKR